MKLIHRLNLMVAVAIIAAGIIPTSSSAQDIRLGVIYSSIDVPHQVYLLDAQVWWQDQGYVKYLSKYPKGILPSGGNSGIISQSEMVIAFIKFDSNKVYPVVFRFYDSAGRLIFVAQTTTSHAAMVGHFDWEITSPGFYWVEVKTPFGDSMVRYEVRP